MSKINEGGVYEEKTVTIGTNNTTAGVVIVVEFNEICIISLFHIYIYISSALMHDGKFVTSYSCIYI